MESVAVDVSETAAKNVSKDEIASDAVAVSDTDELKIKSEDMLSVAVADSDTEAANVLPLSDENGACENARNPNTRHALLILACDQIKLSKPTLLGFPINICPLNQIRHVAIFIHTHRKHWALGYDAV